ncbi:hypothetical protein LC085_17080 [Bacillus tianshenii]|uniref:hypothetical protein n=1 Tax=Sutcliffiella tianshenii TaxID=1463404 RepID=UPI001CD630FB|nr:hypothetical protein [Bacillus tianshenii]MCA1321622.1 hypothetical protein [Bacillus tianshenii]
MEKFDKEIRKEMDTILPSINFSEKEKQGILSAASKKKKRFPIIPSLSFVVAFGIFALLTISFLPGNEKLELSPADTEEVEEKPDEAVEEKPVEEPAEEKEPEAPVEDSPKEVGLIDKEVLRSLSSNAFILNDGDQSYEVFLYLDEAENLSKADPEYFAHDEESAGEVMFFLAASGSPKATHQIHLSEELSTRGLTKDDSYSSIVEDLSTKTLLSLFKKIDEESYEYTGFIVEGGKLTLLDLGEQAGMLYRDSIKVIEKQYVQTVHYVPSAGPDESPHEYKTWKWNEDQASLEFFDSTKPDRVWDYEFTKWIEGDVHSQYVYFQTIKLTKELFSKISEGRLLGVEFALGDNIKEVKEKRSEMKDEHGFKGAVLSSYLDAGYIHLYDTGEIAEILLHRYQLKATKEDVIEILGPPTFEDVNDMDGGYLMEYEIENRLLFIAYREGGYVTIELK